jgi:hypothetical protein
MNEEESRVIKSVVAVSRDLIELLDQVKRDSFITGFVAGCAISILGLSIISIFVWGK